MITLTPQAQKLRDDYLASVRDCLGSSKTIDSEEVVRDISEHIERELENSPQPISESDMAGVIDRLGDPRQWGGDSEQAASVPPTAKEERFTRKFAAEPGGTLVVDVGFGSIAVSTNTTNEVVVDVWRKVGGKGTAHKHGCSHKFHFPFSFPFPKSCGVAGGDFGSVEFNAGKIKVKTGKGRQIEVDVPLPREVTVDINAGGDSGGKDAAEAQGFFQKHPVEVRQNGNTVTVEAGGGNWSGQREAKYTISVPAQFNAKLETSGGSITVNGLEGDVEAETSGGGLRFTGVRGALEGESSGGGIHVADCAGEIELDCSGGGIEVIGGSGTLEADASGGQLKVKDFHGNINVDASGGGVSIENVVGQIDADTSGGGVSAVLSSPLAGDVKLEASGGGITLRVPENAAFELDAETSGGSVSCELPVTTVGKIDRGHLKGIVNGGGKSVRLESTGGSIHVKKL